VNTGSTQDIKAQKQISAGILALLIHWKLRKSMSGKYNILNDIKEAFLWIEFCKLQNK